MDIEELNSEKKKGPCFFIDFNLIDNGKENNNYKKLLNPYRYLYILNTSKVQKEHLRREQMFLKNKESWKTDHSFKNSKFQYQKRKKEVKGIVKSPSVGYKKSSSKLASYFKPKTQKSLHYVSNIFYRSNKTSNNFKSIGNRIKGNTYRPPQSIEEFKKQQLQKKSNRKGTFYGWFKREK